MTKSTLNKWFNPYLRLILGLLLFLSILPDNSPAAEIHVPAQFPTIQAAIDASANNDIIVVDPGLYTENIDFNGKGITVRSTNPLDSTVVAATVIDGNRNGSVVTFKSGETRDSVLSGFTIRNGIGTLLDGKRYGGGIYCGNQATPTIRFNRIINNSADIGGGLYIHGNSSPTIADGPKADYPYAGIGQILHLSVTATDPDNEPLTYRWVSREGGTITGTGSAVTFSANTAGVYPIDLTVDDQHGGLATGTVTVTVIGVTIQTASMPQLSTGNPVALKTAVTPTIADSAQYPVSITWSLTEGPATGSFDAAVNGTPQATSIIFTPTGSGPGRIQAAYRVGTA
ncbi:MAG: PKD domain-containing protein, partial [Pseudomonadota bacterium]